MSEPGELQKPEPDELETTEELFAFLQGQIPEGYKIARSHRPKLTADQAWTVIWFIQNNYHQYSDHIERCCVCGDLYDSWRSGDCLDYGKAPYHFCDNCMGEPAYATKMRHNPDKQAREDYFRA